MSNNRFSSKRFGLLFKQHFIHSSQSLILSATAYLGVIFIVLSLTQVGNNLQPHGLEAFLGFLVGFVTVFGLLYVGHAFPAFRSKESAINYLMLPASVLEKFLFEVVSRIVIVILMLPLLYWVAFHLQGYFFGIFTPEAFKPFGIHHMVDLDVSEDSSIIIYFLITGGVLFVLSLAFTGAAMFTKQPLVKSLFAVAMVVMFFAGYSFIVIEKLGLGKYNPPDHMLLVPLEEERVMMFFSVALLAGTAVMLFVAYRKLKEREV
jgi:hypothetical protein